MGGERCGEFFSASHLPVRLPTNNGNSRKTPSNATWALSGVHCLFLDRWDGSRAAEGGEVNTAFCQPLRLSEGVEGLSRGRKRGGKSFPATHQPKGSPKDKVFLEKQRGP